MGSLRPFNWSVLVLVCLLLLPSCMPQSAADDADLAPSAPLDLQAVAGNAYVELSWSPPIYSNGSAVNEYWIYRGTSDPLELLTTLGNVTTHLDQGLVNGLEYRYAVRAVNDHGIGNLSLEVRVTPRTVPLAPLDPRALPGDRFLNLTWDVPIWDGGAPILSYSIYTIGGSVPIGTADGNHFIHSLLEPLSLHIYQVVAVNEAGEGERSVVFQGVPDTAPGAPANISVHGGTNNVTLYWDHPVENEGSGPSGYRIYRGDAENNMCLLLALDDSVHQYVDYGLAENGTYWYQVSSFNQVGESEPTLPIEVRVLSTADLTITSIVEGDGTVGLYWRVGEQWSSQVIGYWLFRGDGPADLELLRSDLTEAHFKDEGLVNGQVYHYRVAVQTIAGLGWSQNVSAKPYSIPFAPLNLTAEGGDGHILLGWLPPNDDGGSPVLGYKVYMGIDGDGLAYLAESNGTEYVCGGLVTGTVYLFQVRAVNKAGEGELSEVVSEMCGAVPTPPRSFEADWGQGYANLTWDAPMKPGTSPIHHYELVRTGLSGQVMWTVEALTMNDTTVVNGESYEYKVRAVNLVGDGSWSETVTAVPDWNGGPPHQPAIMTVSSGPNFIFLTWNEPNDGGQDITGYQIYRGLTPDIMSYMTMVTQLEYNDTGLPQGSTYFYKVVAINVVGPGPASAVVNATTSSPVVIPEKGFWDSFFDLSAPVTALVILVVMAVSLMVGRWLVLRRAEKKRRKEIAQARKKTGPTSRKTNPPKGSDPQSKEKDKGGRWD